MFQDEVFEGISQLNLLGLLQPERYHWYVDLGVVLHLIELNGAVELRQLLLQQLQVGVDKTQLQRHRLLHLLICGSPSNFI